MATFSRSISGTFGALWVVAMCTAATADFAHQGDFDLDRRETADLTTRFGAFHITSGQMNTEASDKPVLHLEPSQRMHDASLESAARDYWGMADDIRMGNSGLQPVSLADGAKDWRWDNGAPVNFINMGLGHEAFVSEAMARRVMTRGLSFLTDNLELGGHEDSVHEVVPAPASAIGLSLVGVLLVGRRQSRREGTEGDRCRISFPASIRARA